MDLGIFCIEQKIENHIAASLSSPIDQDNLVKYLVGKMHISYDLYEQNLALRSVQRPESCKRTFKNQDTCF